MTKNKHGVPQYPKADARRLFVLLAAVDYLERPTLTTLTDFTGHNKGTIDSDIAKLNEQFGVSIQKEDAVYRVESWGDLLKKGAVKKFLFG